MPSGELFLCLLQAGPQAYLQPALEHPAFPPFFPSTGRLISISFFFASLHILFNILTLYLAFFPIPPQVALRHTCLVHCSNLALQIWTCLDKKRGITVAQQTLVKTMLAEPQHEQQRGETSHCSLPSQCRTWAAATDLTGSDWELWQKTFSAGFASHLHRYQSHSHPHCHSHPTTASGDRWQSLH